MVAPLSVRYTSFNFGGIAFVITSLVLWLLGVSQLPVESLCQSFSQSSSVPEQLTGSWIPEDGPTSNLTVYAACPLLDGQDLCPDAAEHTRISSWTWRGNHVDVMTTEQRGTSRIEVARTELNNKTIAITGDSLSRQFYHAFGCSMWALGANVSTQRNAGGKSLDITTITLPETGQGQSPSSFTMLWNTKLNPYLLAHVDKDIDFSQLDSQLEYMLEREPDYLIINAGVWINPVSFVTQKSDWLQTYTRIFRTVFKEFTDLGLVSRKKKSGAEDDAQTRIDRPTPRTRIFFRTTALRHYENGDYATGGRCDRKEPSEGLVDTDFVNGYSARLQNDIVRRLVSEHTNVQLIDADVIANDRADAHRGGTDCSHWCLPGVPDVWVDVFLAKVGAMS